MAPAFGEDDYRVCKAAGIERSSCPVDADGRFTAEVPDFAGRYVKDADKDIIKRLKDAGTLVQHDTLAAQLSVLLSHRHAAHLPRDPVVVRARRRHRRRPARARTSRSAGCPAHQRRPLRQLARKARRLDDLAQPLLGHAAADLDQRRHRQDRSASARSTSSRRSPANASTDLHATFVDPLTFAVATAKRARIGASPEVLDCWFESGSMPYAQQHYPFENKASLRRRLSRREFIAEGLDQTRGWFYTLMVLRPRCSRSPRSAT